MRTENILALFMAPHPCPWLLAKFALLLMVEGHPTAVAISAGLSCIGQELWFSLCGPELCWPLCCHSLGCLHRGTGQR